MKLHLDTDRKTIAIEGNCKVSIVFNYLMSWFPEEWEEWTFITNLESTKYKEIIVEKEVIRNPYWHPWKPTFYYTTGIDTGSPIPNPTFTTNNQTTLNFNSI